MALTDKLTAIANAIRTQSGKTGKLTLAQMPTEIINLQSLDFEVVGSKPQNPEENTIWVNTDTEITGWHFGADDISGRLDVSNAVNATSFVSGVDANGVISFKGNVSPTWGGTYIGRAYLVAGVKYTLSAELAYGRIGITDNPKNYISDDPSLVKFIPNRDPTHVLAAEHRSNEIYAVKNMYVYIWFCTDQSPADGSKNAFSTKLNLNIANGTVWFSTGNSSPVAFNALKKNGIQVYPISAKQYVGGAWVDKTAQTYQGGKWCDWKLVLYSYGTTSVNWYGGASLEADHIRITGNKTFESDVFNLDGLSSMYIINDYTWDNSNTHSKPKAEILSESGTVLASVELAMVAGVRTKVTLDVSNISGRVKLKLTGVTSNYEDCKIDIYEIVFE